MKPNAPPGEGVSQQQAGMYPPQQSWQQGGPSPSYPQYQQAPGAYPGYQRYPPQYQQQYPPPQGYPGQPQYGAQQQQPFKPLEVNQGYPAAPPPPVQQPNYDPEAAEASKWAESFRDAAVRRGFIRKVLSLVTLMLLFVAGCSLAFYYVAPLKNYVRTNHWVFWVSWGLSLAAILAIGFSKTLRYKTPWNYLFLFGFTVVFGFQIGTITSYWNTQVVLIALVCTAGVVAGCFLIAFCTKLDFTGLGAYLGIAFMVFFIMLLIGIFWTHNVVYIIVGTVGAALFSVHLIYDLQLMMAGKRFQTSPDEYISSALSIFLDIVNIFLMILTIFGGAGCNN